MKEVIGNTNSGQDIAFILFGELLLSMMSASGCGLYACMMLALFISS
jgi:hypothetical protein